MKSVLCVSIRNGQIYFKNKMLQVGILAEQADDVRQAYVERGLSHLKTTQDGNWVVLTLQRI